jgi:hypothetical protein
LGIFVGLFLVLLAIGFYAERQTKAELERADELWFTGQTEEAAAIYTRELEWVEDDRLPEAYERIITHHYDSGDELQAAEYCTTAIEEGVDVRFAREDLRGVLADARRVIEERKAAELARKQAEEQRLAEEEGIRQQESQALTQSKLDAYIAVLEAGEVSIVREVGVRRNGDIWTATLTVDNVWHMKLYQIRLQDAQTLWEAWARIASPSEPDKARISIVDMRGNEVGGSRVWGGSLIWVQEN